MKILFWRNFILSMITLCIFGCKAKASIEKVTFGNTSDGSEIDLYTLINANGLKAKIINYGAILVSLEVPDRNGKLTDITLGFDTLEKYFDNSPYFGATIGRYCNRIAKGKFILDGVTYHLEANSGENHLHGGIKGFNKVLWKASEFRTDEGVGVKLTYLSEDGEEGYPGNLSCTVIYTLTNNNELKINYESMTDKPTIVNLTHHSYFNLAGQGNGNILGHEIMINADKYTPVDENLIPTGEIKSVKDSPLDFTIPKTIGTRIDQLPGGYDHNYVLNSKEDLNVIAARVYEPTSGRVMQIYTTKPGIQFYTGNFLNEIKGKNDKLYNKHYGFCLEPQHFPDSPNKANFPSVTIRPDEKYEQETIFKFSTE